MNRRDTLLTGGVIATMLAWLSWTTMDEPWVEDWSLTENLLDAAGYVLCALALVLLFAGIRLPK